MSRDDERARIPYETGDLAGLRWLVFAPHPDDETLGPGGTLARAAQRGVRVQVVVVTDGAEGGENDDLVSVREAECRRAISSLGLEPPRFLRLPDRKLFERTSLLREALSREIVNERPDLLLVPSPLELHPDHRAVAEAILELVAAGRIGEPLFESWRHAGLAFYEVATPIPAPNLLVDVGTSLDAKRAAIRAYASQSRHDYAGVAEAFLALRRLTLPREVLAAEAFRTFSIVELSRIGPAETIRTLSGPEPRAAPVGIRPISVVVRTRDRASFLSEALESLAAGTVRPREVVVVNDGGESVEPVLARFADRLELIPVVFEENRGRVRAANAGVERTTATHVVLLDDDDIVYPDHLETLGRALESTGAEAVYTDAITTTYRQSDDGTGWARFRSDLQYSRDFDRDLLRLFNYVPLHTLAIPVDAWRALGGFAPDLDLSEDWDFLIRLSQRVDFVHVRRATCEYRTFEGPNAPSHAVAGSAGFQAARKEIYRRHGVLDDSEGLARGIDQLRSEVERLVSKNWNVDGLREQERWRADDADRRAGRAREEIGRLGLVISEGERRIEHLRDDAERLRAEIENRDRALAANHEKLEQIQEQILDRDRAQERSAAEIDRLSGILSASLSTEKALREQLAADETQVASLWGEIGRLNAILKAIESSKAWKLHRFIERIRGLGGSG